MRAIIVVILIGVLIFLFSSILKLNRRVTSLESQITVNHRGPNGRRGGAENGIFGSYSTYWTGDRYREIFIPEPK